MSSSFVLSLLASIGAAVLVGLLVAALIGAGTAQRARRYRPGRPFIFTPVWFLAAPQEQFRAGLVPEMIVRPRLAVGRGASGRELHGGREQVAREMAGRELPGGRVQTGGASERW